MKNCNKKQLPKEEHITTAGTIIDCLPGAKFKVKIDNIDNEVICTLSGKLRMNNIQVTDDDSVEIEISPYDIHRGIIVWRNK